MSIVIRNLEKKTHLSAKMDRSVTLDTLLEGLVVKLDELKFATGWITSREALKTQLCDAKSAVDSIKNENETMKKDLQLIREQNIELQDLIQCIENLKKKIAHMEQNLPEYFVKDFNNLNSQESPVVQVEHSAMNNKTSTAKKTVIQDFSNVNVRTPEPRLENCKKNLFKRDEDSYSMDPLNEEEFSKIPKYMIGRQTLATLNDLVSTINAILEAKYSLLALGKVGARKKGKLDLYLSLKNDEIVVGPGEDPIYFFTADDYYRHTQTKLDKTKLNLLTVLRHCKRIKELRVGKNLQYVLVASSERNK